MKTFPPNHDEACKLTEWYLELANNPQEKNHRPRSAGSWPEAGLHVIPKIDGWLCFTNVGAIWGHGQDPRFHAHATLLSDFSRANPIIPC